jgi:hypothetical protein
MGVVYLLEPQRAQRITEDSKTTTAAASRDASGAVRSSVRLCALRGSKILGDSAAASMLGTYSSD